MDNEKTIKLIKEFEMASKATEEMLNSMDGFKDVLRQYYESYNEIVGLKDKIIESGVVGKVSDAALELSTINKQIATNISMVNESIKDMQNSNSEGLDRIIQIDTKLKGVRGIFEEIKDTVSAVEKLNDAIQKSVVLEFESKFMKMSGAFENIEKVVQSFDSVLDTRLSNIENTILKNYNKVDKHIKQSGKILNETSVAINEASITYNNSNEKLIEEVHSMIETSVQLKMIIESMNSQNQDGIESFSKLADEWAANNIHGMAIKKKRE